MKILLSVLTIVGFASEAVAYEIDTHSRITYAAYASSQIKLQTTQRRLGLVKSRTQDYDAAANTTEFRLHLGNKYYDHLKVGGADRYATAFDAENSWVMKAYRAPKPQRRWFYSQFDGRDEPYFPVDWMAQALICGMIAA